MHCRHWIARKLHGTDYIASQLATPLIDIIAAHRHKLMHKRFGKRWLHLFAHRAHCTYYYYYAHSIYCIADCNYIVHLLFDLADCCCSLFIDISIIIIRRHRRRQPPAPPSPVDTAICCRKHLHADSSTPRRTTYADLLTFTPAAAAHLLPPFAELRRYLRRSLLQLLHCSH